MTADQELADEMVATIAQWVDKEVIPNASDLEHADEFPEAMFEQMCEFGLFGATIEEEYGGLGLDATTYARVVEELSRGWMSLAGILNTHKIGATMISRYGTDEQRQPVPAPDGRRIVSSRLQSLRARRRLRQPLAALQGRARR